MTHIYPVSNEIEASLHNTEGIDLECWAIILVKYVKFLIIKDFTFAVSEDNKMKSIFLFYQHLNFQVVERINSGYRLPPPMVSCSSLKIFAACIKFCFKSSICASVHQYLFLSCKARVTRKK